MIKLVTSCSLALLHGAMIMRIKFNITHVKKTTFDLAYLLLTSRKPARNIKRTKKGWLDGVKVLDLSNVIAGPHSGAVLARYGAQVIKIDPAAPTFDPSYIIYAFNTGQSKKKAH